MDRSTVESLYQLAEEISDKEIKERKNINKKEDRRIFSYFVWICLAPFSAAVTLALANKWYFKEPFLGNVALFFLLFSYLAIMIQPFHSVWIFRKSIFRSIKNPFSVILNNSKIIASADNVLVEKLLDRPIEHLSFLRLELKAEKNALLKRISLVIGAIEKIGLLPGILALLVTLGRLGKSQPEWVYILAYVTPVFYVFGIVMHSLISRIERINMLIEYAIELKKQL